MTELATAVPRRGGFTERAAHAGLDLTGTLAWGNLVVDVPRYHVTRAGHVLELTARQVELLALFLGAPRRIWSREQLEWLCWGATGSSRRVDAELCRLRGKLGDRVIHSVHRRGWSLSAPSLAEELAALTDPAETLERRR